MATIQKILAPLTAASLLLGSGSVLPQPASSSTQADEFMRACAAQKNLGPGAADYRVRSFGADAKTATGLIAAIASGSKTGTFTTPWLYDREPERRPVFEGYAVVTEFDGTPKLVLRTVALELRTFETITEEHTVLESPGARPLQRWRDIHWAFFTRMLAPHGVKPQMSMPVVVERFEIICK